MQDGNTALMHVVQAGVIDMVKLLLQGGADKNIQNKVKNSYIFYMYLIFFIL